MKRNPGAGTFPERIIGNAANAVNGQLMQPGVPAVFL